MEKIRKAITIDKNFFHSHNGFMGIQCELYIGRDEVPLCARDPALSNGVTLHVGHCSFLCKFSHVIGKESYS